jgi:peptide deformylase
MIRPIVKYGDEVLRRTAEPVESVTPEIQTLIDDMVETMYAVSGVGLAAPQIGVSRRVFVADPSSGHRAEDLVIMVNPEIVEREGVQTESEGCLSLPGFEGTISRPTRVLVRGLDRDGEQREVDGTDLLARAFQHEMDHLDGALFLDHLRGFTREAMLRKIRKLRRSGKW